MKIFSDCTPQNWYTDCAEAEDHDFNWRGVFGCHSKRSRILMMDLMNFFIEIRCVQKSMREIMPGIFEDEENCDLVKHMENRGERHSR